MKRFLTSLLVVCLLCSMVMPAQAQIDPNDDYATLEEELTFWPDPNKDVTLPTLPNSKTVYFQEENKDNMMYYSQVMPVTFSECTYEDFTAPDSLGSFARYTNVTIKTGGSIRADFTRNMMVLHDVADIAWEDFSSGMGGLNVEDNIQYSSPEDIARFGITVSNNNHIGYFIGTGFERTVHNIYGRGQTWTFNKPGTYYIRIEDPYTYFMKIKLTVEGSEKSAPTAPTITANPTANKVYVDGKVVNFDAYNLNSNNYFKLRDVALALQGTSKHFEVTWNGSKNAIEILSNQAYTVVGGELTQGDGTAKQAKDCTATIYKDGVVATLKAYTINGNNYFKLRDIGQAFDFDVTWDNVNGCIVIDTTQPYTDN